MKRAGLPEELAKISDEYWAKLREGLRREMERLFRELMDEAYGPVVPDADGLAALELDWERSMPRPPGGNPYYEPPRHDV